MQYKKKLSVIVLLAFVLTMVMPVSAFASGFSDVPSNHWAIQQIDRMNARGIIGGYEDGTARPNNPVTQFEAITMATRIMGLQYNESTSQGTYLPFKYPDWTGAYGVAVIAYEAGLVDASDFNHSAAASREWIAKLLIKIMKAESEVNSVANETLSFGDTNSIGSDYLNYVKLAYDKGLIGGYTDGTFKPKNTVTRAEMAAFLCRVEDKLAADTENVVRGKVTAVSGVNVTIAGTDGKSYSLYATTNSVLYDKSCKKVGVTDLAVGDSVYAVYKNSLLNYLEVRTEEYATNTDTTVVTNLSGTIDSIITAKNTIVVSDEDGQLQTVIVDKNTKINKDGSTIALAFSDLMTDMSVRISVDKDDQTANQIIIDETSDGQKGGTIYNVDVYNNRITIDEKTGLRTYRMSKNIDVSISGMLTATPSSLKEGDIATYTISDGVMVAIAVGENTDSYGGNATVKSIDTTNRIVNYLTTGNDLKAAYYNSGLTVNFNSGSSGSINDLQVGDSINITVSNNQITAITVTSRSISEGLKGTLYSINTTDDYIIITNSNGTRVTYDLASNVKVTLYGDSASLSSLSKGMQVELTLQNNEVTRIKANDLVEGIVKAVNTTAKTIQVTTDSGTETYDVSSNVKVYFYKTTSSRLSSVSVGDTVSMKIVNDEVTIINVNEQVDMTVVDVYSNGNWVRLQDENGNRVSAYLDDVELIVEGIHSSYIRDISVGDDVVATFAGSTLTKLEVSTGSVKGEVTKVNTSTNTLTVKTFSNDTRTIQLNSSISVVKNGASYSSISAISVGDRILVDSTSSSKKTITVMSSKTGVIRYATSGYIQFLSDDLGYSYTTVNGCYCHYNNSTTQFTLANLAARSDSVTIYFTDRSNVYEVVKN